MARARGIQSLISERRFQSLFGVDINVSVIAFNNIVDSIDFEGTPTHSLWVCMFLKVYDSEDVHCNIAQVDRNTFRKVSLYFVSLLSSSLALRI